MKLLKRVGFYLIGVGLGSVIVLFIWKGKDVSFDYGMDARVLSSIRKKQIIYSDKAKESMKLFEIDTTTISTILNNGGDIDFDKSKARQKPCAEYYIMGKDSLRMVHFYVNRCDSIATIETVWKKN